MEIASCCLEVAALPLSVFHVGLLLLLSRNLRGNDCFELRGFAANAGNSVRWIDAFTIFIVKGPHQFDHLLAVDSATCAIEHFISVDRILKVKVALWDVLFDDRPADKSKYQALKRFLKLPGMRENCNGGRQQGLSHPEILMAVREGARVPTCRRHRSPAALAPPASWQPGSHSVSLCVCCRQCRSF